MLNSNLKINELLEERGSFQEPNTSNIYFNNKTSSNLEKERSERPSFNYRAITEHLISLNYSEKSIISFLNCGKKSGIKIIQHCEYCGSNHLINLTHHCNLRICPNCSKRRQRKFLRRYTPVFKNLNSLRNSKESVYFLTISPLNYDTLEEGIKDISINWKKFLKSKYIKDRIKGGLWVLEIKNIGNGWNIHIHALIQSKRLDNAIRGKCLDCGQNYLKYDKFTKQYYCGSKKCGSLNVIKKGSKIQNIFNKISKNNKTMINIQEIRSFNGTLNYVLKYTSSNKDDFQTDKQIAEYMKYTYKKKLVKLFGVFHNLKIPKDRLQCYSCKQVLN